MVNAQAFGVPADGAFAFAHELLVLIQREAVSRLGLMCSHTLAVRQHPLPVSSLLLLLIGGVVGGTLRARAGLAPAGPLADTVEVVTRLHLPALRTPQKIGHRRPLSRK